jgi:hypothetical protein
MREVLHFSTAKNPKDQTIASRDGRLICSPRDPIAEAKSWLVSQKLNQNDKRILVLGAGVAHHIQAAAQELPNSKIDVIELDRETHDYARKNNSYTGQVNFYSNIEEVTGNTYDAILSFRPAWTGYEKEYLEIYLDKTDRSALSEISFKLKNADFDENKSQDEEAKLWKTLRELIG